MSDSLNNKELVAVGHQFAKALSSDTALMDIAKMLTRLAERLDFTTAALHATQAQRDQLAVENAALKEGIGFFSYDSSGSYEEHDNAEKAAAYAEDSISDYRDNAPDGWSDEVGSVVWGVILQRATMVNELPVTDEDAVSPGIETWCDFALLPKNESQNTDAFLAEVRAQGVEGFVGFCGEENSVFVESKAYYRSLSDAVAEFASQLRQEAAQ